MSHDNGIEVAGFILWWLQTAEHPIKRDVLAEGVRMLVQRKHGIAWSPATAARRTREAIAELERCGTAIVSTGDGFRIAKTGREREVAARKLEKMGVSCLRRAASIRGLTLPHEAKQLGLWEAG